MPFRLTATLVLAVAVVAPACSGQKAQGVHQPTYDWLGELRSNTAKTIESPDKAAAILVLITEIERELLEADRTARAHYARIEALNADYDADGAGFEAVFARFDSDVREQRDRVVELRFAIRDLCTAEEWAELSDVDKALLQVWQRNPSLPKP